MSETPLTESQIKELFEKALELHAKGHNDEALDLIKRLLALFPDAFLLHYNAGLIYFEKELFERALPHFEAAFTEVPDEPNIVYNLALCYKKLKQHDNAITLFEQLLSFGDRSEDTLYSLADCHREISSFETAVVLYQQILENNPQHKSATSNLAYTLHRMGDTKAALSMYKKVVELSPEHTGAQHMIAALTGNPNIDMEAKYVEELFDGYSDTFEKSLLDTLEYQVPKLLKNLLVTTFGDKLQYDHALDIGCGTGLAALEISPFCSQITGFDLSAKMVDKAKEKEVYQNLVATDITTFSEQTTERFDLLIAADVFAYLGELDTTFTELSSIAHPKAQLAFTIEHLSNSDQTYAIQSTGRFAHAPEYIEALAKQHSMRLVTKAQENLRREGDKWIVGWLFIFEMK